MEDTIISFAEINDLKYILSLSKLEAFSIGFILAIYGR
jgi:hypothetical protein